MIAILMVSITEIKKQNKKNYQKDRRQFATKTVDIFPLKNVFSPLPKSQLPLVIKGIQAGCREAAVGRAFRSGGSRTLIGMLNR